MQAPRPGIAAESPKCAGHLWVAGLVAYSPPGPPGDYGFAKLGTPIFLNHNDNVILFYLARLKNAQKRLVVIVGPTAVGKTSVAITLARKFSTEVISADSRQIFREMTLGTAKPSASELASVSHHFIDTHSITESYDAAQYGRDALKLIHTLFESHNTLILCGGSGLYIKAVCEGFDDIPEVPAEVRQNLIMNYEAQGISWLQQQMLVLDPEHFSTVDQSNPHRLIRALEIKISTGQSISFFQRKSKLSHNFDIVKIGLELEREKLYQRIDDRMDAMIASGLFDEAKALYSFKNHNALQTVGYQEVFDFLDGKYDRGEAIRLLKRNSRRYAKRQLTWFKRDKEIHWFTPDAIESILNFLDE